MATNNVTNNEQLTTDGQLLIGKTGGSPSASLITAGTNITITNGPGTIKIDAASTGSGTVNAGLINQLAYYAAAGTAVSGLATINSGVLVTSAGGVPSISTTLPAGLTIPGYALSGANADITSMTGLTGYLQAPLGIKSSAGVVLLDFKYVASAVNYLEIYNNTTGNVPTFNATGSDSSVGMVLQTKNGNVGLVDLTGTTAVGLQFYNAAHNQYTMLKAADAAATTATFTLPAVAAAGHMASNASGILSLLGLGNSALSHIGSFTRDLTVATGSVAYTGVGFTPTLIIFIGFINTTSTACWGFANATLNYGFGSYTSGTMANAGGCINALTSGTTYQYAVVSSFDADGFTLSWTKASTPSGTITVRYIAFK